MKKMLHNEVKVLADLVNSFAYDNGDLSCAGCMAIGFIACLVPVLLPLYVIGRIIVAINDACCAAHCRY